MSRLAQMKECCGEVTDSSVFICFCAWPPKAASTDTGRMAGKSIVGDGLGDFLLPRPSALDSIVEIRVIFNLLIGHHRSIRTVSWLLFHHMSITVDRTLACFDLII